MADQNNESRPTVLDQASETQILELERQFTEGDRDAWNTLVTSYGWSNEIGNEVWQWFSDRPEGASTTGSSSSYGAAGGSGSTEQF